MLFTQEQRGDQECVVCYDATSGEQYWIHELKARFDDPLGGPGPRATPVLANGRLAALGTPAEVFTPGLFREVFEVEVLIQQHPDRNQPLVITR